MGEQKGNGKLIKERVNMHEVKKKKKKKKKIIQGNK